MAPLIMLTRLLLIFFAALVALPGMALARPTTVFGMPLMDDRDVLREAHVFHIVLRDLASAEKISQELRRLPPAAQLERFKAVAKARSVEVASARHGGDLGVVRQGDLEKSFEDQLFMLRPNQVSEPIQSEFGWHVVYLNYRVEESMADKCQQSLAAAAAIAPKADQAFWEFSAKATVPEDLHPTVLEYMRFDWGPPLKDGDQNLVYLRAIPATTDNRVVVTQHTEFTNARYYPGLNGCARSARVEFEVDCTRKAFLPMRTARYEGRAARGRVLESADLSLLYPARPTQDYGQHFHETVSAACAAR